MRVISGSILTRFISWTDLPTRERIAPCMMSAAAIPWDRWLITSASANTVHTPDIDTATLEVSASAPICSVPKPM